RTVVPLAAERELGAVRTYPDHVNLRPLAGRVDRVQPAPKRLPRSRLLPRSYDRTGHAPAGPIGARDRCGPLIDEHRVVTLRADLQFAKRDRRRNGMVLSATRDDQSASSCRHGAGDHTDTLETQLHLGPPVLALTLRAALVSDHAVRDAPSL